MNFRVYDVKKCELKKATSGTRDNKDLLSTVGWLLHHKKSQPTNQSFRLETIHWFILIGALVKSFNRVDLIVFAKSLNRVHTLLYVFKSFDKVDLIFLIASNRADHQKW